MGDRPIVFVDFDGVLNSVHTRCRWLNQKEANRYMSQPLCARRIMLLDGLCRDAGAVVVFSTAWRCFKNESTATLLGYLQEGGFTGDALGSTPDMSAGWPRNPYETGKDRALPTRGNEIKTWLDEHAPTAPYVVLEDCEPMDPLPPERIVWTKDQDGLTEERVVAALEVLRG